MNAAEAQEKMYSLHLQEESEQRIFREQARGVASAINREKVIKLSNKAIEVFVD